MERFYSFLLHFEEKLNMKALLSSALKPNFCDDIIRLGRKNDGGYLVSKSDVTASDKLLSFGIYDDWSFEEDFAKINDVPIVAFDAGDSIQILNDYPFGSIARDTSHFVELTNGYLNNPLPKAQREQEADRQCKQLRFSITLEEYHSFIFQ